MKGIFRYGKISEIDKIALSGNRTRAPRVAGEDSTTEPTVLMIKLVENSEQVCLT